MALTCFQCPFPALLNASRAREDVASNNTCYPNEMVALVTTRCPSSSAMPLAYLVCFFPRPNAHDSCTRVPKKFDFQITSTVAVDHDPLLPLLLPLHERAPADTTLYSSHQKLYKETALGLRISIT